MVYPETGTPEPEAVCHVMYVVAARADNIVVFENGAQSCMSSLGVACAQAAINPSLLQLAG